MSTIELVIAAPFESCPFCAQTALFSSVLAMFIVFAVAMHRNAEAMRAGGTGIVGLQRAGSPAKAHKILTD